MRFRMRDIAGRVYLKYGLLTIPGTAGLILVLIVVHHFLPIPGWLWITLVVLWLAKEIIMFPFVWQAYDQQKADATNSMIGAKGVTKERLAPTGYVLVQGELWKAEKLISEPPIDKGRRVRVEKIQGLKLFVVRDRQVDPGSKTDNSAETGMGRS